MRAFPANIAVNTGGRFVPRVETKAANTGYRAALGVSLAVLFLCGSAAGPLATAYLADRRVDIGRIADQWPERFDLVGSKTEPTWVEYVKLSRRGDLFLLEGGGLAGLEQAVEGVEVDKNGTIRHVHCPPMRDCSDSGPLSGFLASAQFVAYHRAGLLSGSADVVAYGDRHVFCLPGEAIGVKDPILDPCFDLATGAVLAQRHRSDGSWSGPSLDQATIRLEAAAPPASGRNYRPVTGVNR
jgi:hypothetical protein